jgi:dynein heavy chain 1, cytosolic
MRLLSDDDDEVTPAAGPSTSEQPAWMRSLLERCSEWLDQLPAVSCCDHFKSLALN